MAERAESILRRKTLRKEIQKIGDKVLQGERVSMKELLPLLGATGPDILEIAAVANRSAQDDFRMIEDVGFKLRKHSFLRSF